LVETYRRRLSSETRHPEHTTIDRKVLPMSKLNPNCHLGCDAAGRLGEDDQGRAIPCPSCKSHLRICPDCGFVTVHTTTTVHGIAHNCLGRHPSHQQPTLLR